MEMKSIRQARPEVERYKRRDAKLELGGPMESNLLSTPFLFDRRGRAGDGVSLLSILLIVIIGRILLWIKKPLHTRNLPPN